MEEYAINYIYNSLIQDIIKKCGHALTSDQYDLIIYYIRNTYMNLIKWLCLLKPDESECREAIKKFLDLYSITEDILYKINSKELNLLLDSNDNYYATFESYRCIITIFDNIEKNIDIKNEFQLDLFDTTDAAVETMRDLINYIDHMSLPCRKLARTKLPYMIKQLANIYSTNSKVNKKLEWFAEVSEKLNVARDKVYIYIYNILLESNPTIDEIEIKNFTTEFFHNHFDRFFNLFFLANTYDNIYDEYINKLCEDSINLFMLLINSYNKLRGDFQ